MQRDSRAYLNDVIEACEAIEQALTGMDLAAYGANTSTILSSGS
jgi:uncharacterized protein with HEPN domain